MVFHFLIVAVDESQQFVDGAFVQLNYIVDGLTKDCREKRTCWGAFPFFY